MDVLPYVLDLRALILEGLVLINLLFGTFVGTMKEGFNPDKFGAWFEKDVLKVAVPYVFALAASIQALPGAASAFTLSTESLATWGLLIPAVVKVGWSIYVNLKKLLGTEPPSMTDAAAGAKAT